MIDLLTVNYRNYDLLNLQLNHLSNLDCINECRLIVVENTPKKERMKIDHDLISELVVSDFWAKFDGVSHGTALDLGMNYVNSEFFYVFDTDYFILKRDFFPVFVEEIKRLELDAIGPEFFDGRDWFTFRQSFPESLDGTVAPWGAIYRTDLIKSDTWVATLAEVKQNEKNGFVEVGWKHRKKMLERGKRTIVFEGYQKNYEGIGNCYFRHKGEDIGFHYMRASYDRMAQSVQEIKDTLK